MGIGATKKKKEDEERRRKIKKEQQQKEEETRRKELEKRRKLKELEEEKEAEMEQKKKKNHEWDINCKGNGMKVNEQIVNGSNAYETIWLKGIVAEGTNEWKFKIIDAGNV